VIITCPQCETQYRYEEARFGGAPRKKLKCTQCAFVFEVVNPASEPMDSTNVARKAAEEARVKVGADTDRLHLEPEQPELPQLAPLPQGMRFALAIIAGSQAGSVFPLTKPRVYIGRGSNMDVQLKDAETSRRHAMLEIRGEKTVLLTDLGSTNGTFVAGERVQRVELGNQSEFTLGSTTVMLIITDNRDSTV
jgi:predicted Zn finger-like uncharacterized protein